MESKNYLGIYLSKGTATVVCLGSQGGTSNVVGCFSVSVEQHQQANLPAFGGWPVLSPRVVPRGN